MNNTQSQMTLLDSIIGVRLQDETGAKYTVKGYRTDLQEIYITLESTLGSLHFVNLNRYDELVQMKEAKENKKWEDYARVPYTITAGI